MQKDNSIKIKETLQQLDIALLQSYIDSLGKNIVEKMFALYKQQVTIYLADIDKALLADNSALWQEHCHKMKGACASAGLTRLHGILIILEKTEAQQAEKKSLLVELKYENSQTIAAMQQWLTEINE